MKKIKDYYTVDGHTLSLYFDEGKYSPQYVIGENENNLFKGFKHEKDADDWAKKHKGRKYSELLLESMGF